MKVISVLVLVIFFIAEVGGRKQLYKDYEIGQKEEDEPVISEFKSFSFEEE